MFHHLTDSTVPTAEQVASTIATAIASYDEMIAAAQERGDSAEVARLTARRDFFSTL